MQRKKILLLGASAIQIPPILYAKDQGYHVITCDNIPTNPGHHYADESFNISTTDKEAVLTLATEQKIDAIVAYASDPSAPTAAYVGNQLGLISNPYESVCILTDKTRYRRFLRQNNFNVPQFIYASSIEDALKQIDTLSFPLMVKPADSSGSKGVRKIHSVTELPSAFDYAFGFARNKLVIIEEYIQRKGYQIAGDAFILDGKITFHCLANEHFNDDCNPNVPIGESFPSMLDTSIQESIIDEINRLLTLLGMNAGAINIDAIIDHNNNIYIMEIGPRNGGNLIPEVIRYSTNIDLVAYTVESALGNDCSALQITPTKDYYASYIIHSEHEGTFNQLSIDEPLKDKIIDMKLYAKPKQSVYPFNGSQFGLGSIILRFNSMQEMLETMPKLPKLVHIQLEEMVHIST